MNYFRFEVKNKFDSYSPIFVLFINYKENKDFVDEMLKIKTLDNFQYLEKLIPEESVNTIMEYYSDIDDFARSRIEIKIDYRFNFEKFYHSDGYIFDYNKLKNMLRIGNYF